MFDPKELAKVSDVGEAMLGFSALLFGYGVIPSVTVDNFRTAFLTTAQAAANQVEAGPQDYRVGRYGS